MFSIYKPMFLCLFVLLLTAMVMAGRSVHPTTLFFLGKLEPAVNQYFIHILSLVLLDFSLNA